MARPLTHGPAASSSWAMRFRGSCSPSCCWSLFAGGSYWQIFPARPDIRGRRSGTSFRSLGKMAIISGTSPLPTIALTISSFATLTLLTKNSFLDELRKQYVMTARAKGLVMENGCFMAMCSATPC
jgi:ABC-type microcin C transport system permease subunit YejB